MPEQHAPREQVNGSQKAPDYDQERNCSEPRRPWSRRPGWLRAGMVSEYWKKWAIVCLRSLPQGHESFLLLSPEAKRPAAQDNTVNEASLSCPQLRRHICVLQATNGIASAPCCKDEVSFQSAPSRFWESMNIQFGIGAGNSRSQVQAPPCPPNTGVRAEAHMCPMT